MIKNMLRPMHTKYFISSFWISSFKTERYYVLFEKNRNAV